MVRVPQRRAWSAAGTGAAIVLGLLAVLGPVPTAAADAGTGPSAAQLSTASAALADLQERSARLQRELLEAITAHQLAQAQAEQISARAELEQRQADRAEEEAGKLRGDLGRFAAYLYRNGGVDDIRMGVLTLPTQRDAGGAMHAVSWMQMVGEAKSLRVTQAIAAEERARQLAAATARTAQVRREAAARAAEAKAAIEAKAKAVEQELVSRVAALNAAYAAGGTPVTATGAAGTGGTLWAMPMAMGTYGLSAEFGAAGPQWSSGRHSGQDFAAPLGTPVYAASAGVVRVEHPSWAGNLVRIEHAGNLESWYAHMAHVFVAPGQQVAAGTVIGAVGSLGNSTGPHLHFEARLAGQPVDPTPFLTGSQSGWGGYLNGLIPASQLCPIGVGGHALRCDAAKAWRELSRAYAKVFGRPLCLTDSYRTYQAQAELFVKKPSLAALPGTSNHGWGVAVDLCGGVNEFGTAQHAWVAANGPRFGWYHPRWAASDGSRPEPWHFEFGRA